MHRFCARVCNGQGLVTAGTTLEEPQAGRAGNPKPEGRNPKEIRSLQVLGLVRISGFGLLLRNWICTELSRRHLCKSRSQILWSRPIEFLPCSAPSGGMVLSAFGFRSSDFGLASLRGRIPHFLNLQLPTLRLVKRLAVLYSHRPVA